MKYRFIICFLFFTACVFAEDAARQSERDISEIDLGPLFFMGKDIAGNRRWRALGPLIERRETPEGQTLSAVRPLYSRSETVVPEKVVDEHVVWPVWTRRVVEEEEQWSILQVVFWHDWDTTSPDSRYSFRILPLYFQGRDSKGENYLAIVPLGGSIHEFLLQDKISFVLFPLYTHFQVNDLKTWGYPWPIISGTSGGKVERFNVFPFYGRSKRGEDFNKHYILWPFWNFARFGFEGDTGYGYIIFPLFGHAKLDHQETFFFLPPFIRFTKGSRMNLIYCPWPFFQKTSGEEGVEDKLYIWPLWGRKNSVNRNTWFFLWPLVLGERHMEKENIESRRTVVLPVFFNETRRKKHDESTSEESLLSRQLKIWPLMSYWKEDDQTMFRAPSLWPFKDYRAIERNYSPLWTLYTSARSGDTFEDEFLWGLFRYRRSFSGEMNLSLFPLFSISREEDNKGREWSFLKGLVGYERIDGVKKLRLLYLFKIGLGQSY